MSRGCPDRAVSFSPRERGAPGAPTAYVGRPDGARFIDPDRYSGRVSPSFQARTTTLDQDTAAAHARWYATLADANRIRLLHAVAGADGPVTVGHLAARLGISQSTCSHHVRRLAEVGVVHVRKVGTASEVTVDETCRTRLPHPADVVLGTLTATPAGPAGSPTSGPAGVIVRAVDDADLQAVLAIYAEGIATRNATFETKVPPAARLRRKWLPGHAWVAEIDGEVVGWTAVTPVSDRECYAGVGESSVYVAASARGRGVGKALVDRQVTAADEGGLWTLQTVIFPENRASLALHRSAGYRTLAVRSRIAQLDGEWRDTVLLERRSGVCG